MKTNKRILGRLHFPEEATFTEIAESIEHYIDEMRANRRDRNKFHACCSRIQDLTEHIKRKEMMPMG